jgi:hypothetical protein
LQIGINIRTDTIEEIILNGLKDNLMDPDLFKDFAREFVAEVNRMRMEEAAEIDAARSEHNRIENQIDKLVMAIADEADALPLNTKIKELEGRQQELQDMLDHASEAKLLVTLTNLLGYSTRIAVARPKSEAKVYVSDGFVRPCRCPTRFDRHQHLVKLDPRG